MTYKKMYIFPLSDLHVGHNNFNHEWWNVWEEEFRSAPSNKHIYLLGDLIEAPSTKVSAYDCNLSTHDMIDVVVNMLKPYRDYIRYSCTGNHEARMNKDFNLDVNKVIADRLDVPHSKNDFFDSIDNIVVYGKHGTSTSKSPDLAMNNFKKDMGNIEANICLQGHNHYCAFSSNYVRNENKGYRRYYGFTGHFLNYKNSYAHDKGYIVSPASFQRLEVSNNGVVQSKQFFADEIGDDLWS